MEIKVIRQIFDQAKELLSRMASREEKGQGLIEYALIILLVVIVVIAALTLVGPEVQNMYCSIYAGFGGTGVCP